MSRALLIETVRASTNCSHRVAAKTANDIIETLADALVSQNKLVLSNFGIFRVVPTKSRRVANVHTGDLIIIPAGKAVRFRVSAHLRARVSSRSKAIRAASGVITHPAAKGKSKTSTAKRTMKAADEVVSTASSPPARMRKARARTTP
jgi:DNA-binding protein HU-beta